MSTNEATNNEIKEAYEIYSKFKFARERIGKPIKTFTDGVNDEMTDMRKKTNSLISIK